MMSNNMKTLIKIFVNTLSFLITCWSIKLTLDDIRERRQISDVSWHIKNIVLPYKYKNRNAINRWLTRSSEN